MVSFLLAINASWKFGVPEKANMTLPKFVRSYFWDILVDISGTK